MAEKDGPAVEQQAAPKNNKKLFIIIGAGVVGLVVVLALVFTLAGKGEKKGGAQEAKAEKGEAKGEGKGEKAASNIFPLDPFIVNIYDGQELRYLKVKVELEMPAPEAKAMLDARQSQIRDAILVLLTTKTLQEVQDLQGKNQLREEILATVNKIITPSKISKVYFTDFVVQ